MDLYSLHFNSYSHWNMGNDVKIKDIITKIQDVNTPPGELASIKGWLCGEYAFISSQLQDIITHKPIKWREIRNQVKSDKQADELWNETDIGRDEVGYKMQLKVIEKLMSGVNTMLRVKEGEAKNQF